MIPDTRKKGNHPMQENEKNFTEETAELQPLSEDTAIEPAQEVSAELSTESAAELPVADAPAYHWDFSASPELQKEQKKRRSALIYAGVMTGAFLISFAVLLVLLLTSSFNLESLTESSSNLPTGPVSERIVYVREYDSESGVLTTQEIYDKCLPSIVSISVSSTDGGGVGSGFIISDDGYIVTANHVVADATSVSVILSDNKIYSAKVIDGNEFTDVALIKIDATDLTPIEIGSSSDLLVGDSVVAIGTPASLNFAGSLATGHVSYQNRIFKISDGNGGVEKKMTLIQTNALVNPGNSGCPLINEYGEAVGIVTMKLNSNYYEGMCFAIPLDAAMPIIEAMRDGEEYSHLLGAISSYSARIGVQIKNTTVPGTDEFGLKIEGFTANNYDAVTKLRTGDIITHLNGVKFDSSDELSLLLDKCKPGDKVSITFYRNGQYQTVYVILGK